MKGQKYNHYETIECFKMIFYLNGLIAQCFSTRHFLLFTGTDLKRSLGLYIHYIHKVHFKTLKGPTCFPNAGWLGTIANYELNLSICETVGYDMDVHGWLLAVWRHWTIVKKKKKAHRVKWGQHFLSQSPFFPLPWPPGSPPPPFLTGRPKTLKLSVGSQEAISFLSDNKFTGYQTAYAGFVHIPLSKLSICLSVCLELKAKCWANTDTLNNRLLKSQHRYFTDGGRWAHIKPMNTAIQTSLPLPHHKKQQKKPPLLQKVKSTYNFWWANDSGFCSDQSKPHSAHSDPG